MDYSVKLKQIRESAILKKIPQDAIGFLFSQIASNFNNSDFATYLCDLHRDLCALGALTREGKQKRIARLAPLQRCVI